MHACLEIYCVAHGLSLEFDLSGRIKKMLIRQTHFQYKESKVDFSIRIDKCVCMIDKCACRIEYAYVESTFGMSITHSMFDGQREHINVAKERT